MSEKQRRQELILKSAGTEVRALRDDAGEIFDIVQQDVLDLQSRTEMLQVRQAAFNLTLASVLDKLHVALTEARAE